MPANIREFHRASTAAQTLDLLRRTATPTAALVAAPRMPDDPFAQVEAVIDLQTLPFATISTTGAAIRIGALADLQTVATAAPLAVIADGIVSQAAQLAAHFGLRNLATVAGAIAGAMGEPPGPPEVLLALLALDAQVAALDAADTLSPLADYRPAPTALLAEVVIPSPVAWHGALARVARSPLDQAIVAAVATVSPATARVAVAGASPAPFVVAVERSVAGADCVAHLVDAVTAQAAPHGDYRGSAAYRRAMAEVLARRVLTQALSNEASA